MPKGVYPRPSPVVRFWERVRITPGCWLWTGNIDKDGYGRLSVCCETIAKAHRFSYEIHFGKIPDGHGVLHKCDTPACVNPDHFFTGDNAVNQRDCSEKGRSRLGKKNGMSKLDSKKVLMIRSSADTCRAVAKILGVSPGAVAHVRSGRTWRSIP